MSDIRQIARQAADAEYRAWHRSWCASPFTLLVDRVADAVALTVLQEALKRCEDSEDYRRIHALTNQFPPSVVEPWEQHIAQPSAPPQTPKPTYTAGEIADPAFYRVQPAALPDIEALRYDLERLKDELRIESAAKAAMQVRLVQQELNMLKEANRNE
jgi:hypothetical protein